MKNINDALLGTGIASAFSFVVWAISIACYLVGNENFNLSCLISSTIIWLGTFILLLVLLWQNKEMHLEEIRRDMRILDLIKQEKNNLSKDELSKKLEELKGAVKEIVLTIEKREGRN